MKKLFTLLSAVCFTVLCFAQSPQKMSFQAVIRNGSNQLVTSQTVGMRISILQTTSTGTAVYVETQTPTTNINGLVSIEIGSGTVVSGTFASINWAAGPYYIKTETDPTGGTAYSITGVTQILSVPYALLAKNAENDWSITGNAGTTAGTNFIGTTDAKDFIVKTNNAEQLKVTSAGKVGIGMAGRGCTFPLEITVPSTGGSQMNLKLTNLTLGIGSGVGMLFAPDDAAIAKMGIFVERREPWGLSTMHFLSRTSHDYVSADLSNSVMSITSNGYVGMGTTAPATRLEVSGVITATGGTSTNWNTAYGWGNHAGLYRASTWSPAWADISGKPSIKDSVQTYSFSGNYNDLTNKLAINQDGSGNIGIGTITPTNKLSVTGNIDASGFISSPSYQPLAGDGKNLEIRTSNAASGSGAITIKTGDIATNGGATGGITLSAGKELWTGLCYGASLSLGGYPGSNGSGSAVLSGGNSWADGGGDVSVQAGNKGWGMGGNVYITGGNGGSGAGGGGSIVLTTGIDSNAGAGSIIMKINTGEALRINPSANVGIGTTTPATKLDVAGVVTATGGNSTNWNTAYGWGNHASAGYLTTPQTLRLSNDTIYLSNGGSVKIPEVKTIPALITKEDFSCTAFKNYWVTAVTGGATIGLTNSTATLSTNGGGNTAKLYTNKQKSLNDGKLIFTAVVYTYEDNNAAYGPLVRGLVNGIDRSNAIEFINVSGNTIQCRTVAGGTATTTNYAMGASVANFYAYTIIATKTRVEFYVDGNLIATHTTNIPTANLNMYFDTSTSTGNVPIVIDDARFEIIR